MKNAVLSKNSRFLPKVEKNGDSRFGDGRCVGSGQGVQRLKVRQVGVQVGKRYVGFSRGQGGFGENQRLSSTSELDAVVALQDAGAKE